MIFIGVLILSIFSWFQIGKEEMPEFASNWLRVTISYPGASAQDIELFVIRPIEEELKEVAGLEEVNGTSSEGMGSFQIVIDEDYPDQSEVVKDIKDAVLRAKLPSEIRDLPQFRQFKSAEKAIMDIGLYLEDHPVLDDVNRKTLQAYALEFEHQILTLPEISSIEKSYYLRPELHIEIDPLKINQSRISLSEIKQQIQSSNIRAPLGSLYNKDENKVLLIHELEEPQALSNLVLRSNYSGMALTLGELAKIKNGFERSNNIFKINGHEGIFINIKKSVSTDILTAQKEIIKFLTRFQETNKENNLKMVVMDDESLAVKNRLNIITSNAAIGFILILVILFIFLDPKSGFWVAMGIPFSSAFTLVVAMVAGYTINNMTLAGIIIVLGIVVDDAIIISENVARKREQGLDLMRASCEGTLEMIQPILGSVITTCVAFVPLFYFEGFHGKLVYYIPIIVILMLLGSLIESIFILPCHLATRSRFFDRFTKKNSEPHWFHQFEKKYKTFVMWALSKRILILILSFLFLFTGIYLFQEKMKYVMFPREESTEVIIKVKTLMGTNRLKTSELIFPLEKFISKDTVNVVGVRSTVAVTRRGGQVRENEATILVEVLPADQRSIPLKRLIQTWQDFSNTLPGFESIKFQRDRWGKDDGDAVELDILDNDDITREAVTLKIRQFLENHPEVLDVEIDDPLKKLEYHFGLDQMKLSQLDINPSDVISVLKSFVDGQVLYSINKGEEDIEVRLSVGREFKKDINEIFKLKVSNKQGLLTDLNKIITLNEKILPVNIVRSNYKRLTHIQCSLKENTLLTPLEIAAELETKLFPKLQKDHPTTMIYFRGEIEDSRESKGIFIQSIIMVILLIYFILVVLFDSLSKPFIILSIIPFGLASVIVVFVLHQLNLFGFFSVIGTLGMIGTVINDAIVMIDRLNKQDWSSMTTLKERFELISTVAASRLRAVLLTTLTTVAGVLPTAYGIAGYDSMLSEMMLALGYGLLFGTFLTLILIPIFYSLSPLKNIRV